MRSLLCSLLFISTILIHSASAQAPKIASIYINEHFGQLYVYGSFGASVPTVTVDTAHLKVLQNNDTLIRCTIPASGPGSAGDVTVTDSNGSSNTRRISMISLTVYYSYNSYTKGTNPTLTGASGANLIYALSFRGDLSHIRDSGFTLDPVEDSIKGSFGSEMSSYYASGNMETNIVEYSAQGNISAYPVPSSDGNQDHTPVDAQLDYHDSSIGISVGQVNYTGTSHTQTMATSTSQPQYETGEVSGYAAPFTLHYKVMPDYTLKLVRIDSSTTVFVDPEIGINPEMTSFVDPMPATIAPVPILAVASVMQVPDGVPAPVLYPNPASDVVSTTAPNSHIEIYDALGRTELYSESGTINVRQLKNGMYFYRIEYSGTAQTGNLIVRH